MERAPFHTTSGSWNEGEPLVGFLLGLGAAFVFSVGYLWGAYTVARKYERAFGWED